MKFVDYYLNNKDKFPDLEFYEIKYSGDNVGYNSDGEMKYLEHDMIIMIPSICSQIFKEHLKYIDKLKIYSYFNDLFFKSMTQSEKENYESLFLTSDNKMLITIKGFTYNKYNAINLKEYKEMKTLLKKINSFLTISNLELIYSSIRLSDPEHSNTWRIQSSNFTSIKEYDLKLIDYALIESSKINFKKIKFKK